MRGSVLLLLASLGLAAVLSVLFWYARRVVSRRPTPFLKQLRSVAPVPGKPVGPSSGISRLDTLAPAATATPDPPVSATSSERPAPTSGAADPRTPAPTSAPDPPDPSER